MSYMNNEERHICDECSKLCLEINIIENDLEELHLCNDCYEDYEPLDEAEKEERKKDALDQIAEDNYRDR